MMKTCLSCDAPASVRYPRGVSLGVPMDPEPMALPIGKGELLRDGTDVAIVAIGVTVWQAHQGGRAAGARRDLYRRGQRAVCEAPGQGADRGRGEARPVSASRWRKARRWAASVRRCLNRSRTQGITHLRTKLIGLPDWFIEQGPQDLLRERYGLTAEGIYESIKALMGQAEAAADRVGSFTGGHLHGDEQGS